MAPSPCTRSTWKAGRYEVKSASALVPGLDFDAVARYARREDTPQALREFEAEPKRRVTQDAADGEAQGGEKRSA